MSKLEISEDMLREVLLSMHGEEVQQIFLEVKKEQTVSEMMDFGVESIMGAVKSLEWMDYVENLTEEIEEFEEMRGVL